MQDFSWYKGKKVLVTGHTGFKGSWLCRMLTGLGAEVTGYSLEAPTEPSLFEISGLDGRMKSVIGDIRDYDHLLQVFTETKPEIVLHLAAQPIVRESYREPRYTYETNVMGTVNLLDADVVPHMGWDTIEAAPDSVLLNGVENERFYFVHSYAAMEVKPADTSRFDIDLSDSPERVSWCSYGRSRFVAAYEHGPLSATQFHPEKSGDAGSQLLKNWIATL